MIKSIDGETWHHAKRMKGKRAQLLREAAKELEQIIHMLFSSKISCSHYQRSRFKFLNRKPRTIEFERGRIRE